VAVDQTELRELITRMSDGDRAAFGEFYDATVSRVFGVVMRITRNKELTEEVVSDAYMQAWRNAVKYDRELAAPTTWLIMIARSRAIDAIRRERSVTKNQVVMHDDFESIDEVVHGPLLATLGLEQSETLVELLKLLDKDEYQMIMLSFYRGYSHSEIAQYTGKPLGSVKTLLRRAQAILRASVKKVSFVTDKDHGKSS